MHSGPRRHAGTRAATAGTLGKFRAELERQPRDPFKVDAERAAAELRRKWGGSYEVKPCQGGYEAVRLQGPRLALTAETPDELERKMLADWTPRPDG